MQLRSTTVGVLGLGTMGHGIVQAFASCGIPVHAYDNIVAARANLLDRVRSNLLMFAHHGLIDQDQVEPTLHRITIHDRLEDACRPTTFVIEAVREDLAVKQALFQEIEDYVAEETILASNSSTFPISQSGSRLKRPQRALVAHWINPPHIVPTVEIVPSPQTSEEVTQATLALHRQIGKQAILIRQELPGFLVNRVQVAVMREAWDLYSRGVASAEDIDAAICGSLGFRLAQFGPLQINDFGGLDILATVYRNLGTEICSTTSVPDFMQKLLAAGHLGFKSGQGFYSYPPDQTEQVLADRDDRYVALMKLLQDQTRTEQGP